MNKTTEALKLAEEALHDGSLVMQALAAIREALAEQDYSATSSKPITKPVKQEPVAWGYIDADGSFMDALDRQHGAYQTPLYAAPVQPAQEPVAVVKKSLTTELLADALISILKMDVKGYELQERLQFSTAGRQLLEKANNALSAQVQPVKQEPVAWYIPDKDLATTDSAWAAEYQDDCEPLYRELVDAKAIRAEALEEAAIWCDYEASEHTGEGQQVVYNCAAGIRGLK